MLHVEPRANCKKTFKLCQGTLQTSLLDWYRSKRQLVGQAAKAMPLHCWNALALQDGDGTIIKIMSLSPCV